MFRAARPLPPLQVLIEPSTGGLIDPRPNAYDGPISRTLIRIRSVYPFMGQEGNIQVFEEWIAAHRAHDLDKLLTFITDDIRIQSSAGSSMPPANGKEEARVHWGTIFETFPDMRMEKVDLTPGEDRIFAEISHGGTMKGKMGDWEPTGKEYRTQGAFRIDFRKGKIRSILSYWDTATMLRQLGLIPGPD